MKRPWRLFVRIILLTAAALLPLAPAQAQLSDSEMFHALADYWRKQASDHRSGADAATSPTKQEVWRAVAEKFDERAAKWQSTADAADKAMAERKNKPVQPWDGTLPKVLTPSRPALAPPILTQPLPLPLPQLSMNAKPDPNDPHEVARNCMAAADAFTTKSPARYDYAEMLRRRSAYIKCGAPLLHDRAAQLRRQADKHQDENPPTKDPEPGSWGQRKDTIMRTQETVWREMADHLDAFAVAIEQGGGEMVSSSVPDPGFAVDTVEKASTEACPGLAKAATPDGTNDPYLLCDCARHFVTGPIAEHFATMMTRVKARAWTPEYLFSAIIQPFYISEPKKVLEVMDSIAWEQPSEADQHLCREPLMSYEDYRARQNEPHSPRSNPTDHSDMIGYELKNAREAAYLQVRNDILNLWKMAFDDVEIGWWMAQAQEADAHWHLYYQFKTAIKGFYEKWKPLYDAQSRTGTVDITGYATDTLGQCVKDNASIQSRIEMDSATLAGVLRPMRDLRTKLRSELLQWQDVADRDGWPTSKNEISLRTVADQLWATRYPGEAAQHRPERQTIGVDVFSRPRLEGLVDPSLFGYGVAFVQGGEEFFTVHDDCSLWKPRPTGAAHMIAHKPVASSSDEGGLEPTIKQALLEESGFANQAIGPVTSAAVQGLNEVHLAVHFFEKAPQLLEYFASGAAATERP
jgi:hypothetical protein